MRLGDGRCDTKLVENSAANTEARTLRAAIQEAHASTGVGKITSDSRTIRLIKTLPVIQTPVEINFNGTTIDGSGVNTMASGLHIKSEETIVRSAVIHGFR